MSSELLVLTSTNGGIEHETLESSGDDYFDPFFADVTGCGGGGVEVKSHTTTTTVGRKLMDLELAYKGGVITEKEYESVKKKY